MPCETIPELRQMLKTADTASYAAYRLGEVAGREGATLGGLAENGLLADITPLLQDDPCTEAAYYALKTLFDALSRCQEEIAAIAKEPGCLQAILAVLRSGPGSCTQACQHLSAALLWSTAANPGCVGQLAGCTGLVSTFLTVFNPEIDSGIQAAVSGALAHLVGCAPVCHELNTLASTLPTLATFLCALTSSAAGAQPTAPQPGGTEDCIYMRIHGMQILSSTLETAPRSSRERSSRDKRKGKREEALSRVLMWLLSDNAVPQGSNAAARTPPTLLSQLQTMHERCLAAVVSAIESQSAVVASKSSSPIATTAAKLLSRDFELRADDAEAHQASETTAGRMSLRLCRIILQLSAHLASESARCRLAIGRESGFVAGLVRFMSTLGEEDDSAEAVAAAVAVLSQLAREPKFCGKIVRGSEKGRRARQPAMTVIARLAAAAAAGGRARRALTPVVSDFLMEVVNSGEWVVADDAADEFHRELASVVAWLVDDVEAETTDRLSTLLSQLLIKFASRQQISAAEGGRPTWDSFLHSGVHLMAGRNCYRASVMLAHSLRQAAALGGPEAALVIASNGALQAAIAAGLERGAAVVSRLSDERGGGRSKAMSVDEQALAIEAAEAGALFIASLADAHGQAAAELASIAPLVSTLKSIVSRAQLPSRVDADLQATAAGACAAAAGALAALYRGRGPKAGLALAAAAPHDYESLKCLCLLLTSLPIAHPYGQKGSAGGGARGGAEHVVELLAAIATSGDKEGAELVAEAVQDCAGALEALVAMLPQPPVTKGSVQPDADWRNGVVPSPASFGSGGMAVLRLLHVLAMSPDVAQVMADEVDLFPPLLWACLTREEVSEGGGTQQRPAELDQDAAATSADEAEAMPASTLAIAIVHLIATTLEVPDRQDMLSIPFVMDALFNALDSKDGTATAAAVLAVSSFAGLQAFQALLLVQPQTQNISLSLNRLKLGAPIPSLAKVPPAFSRHGTTLVKALISQLRTPPSAIERSGATADGSEDNAMTPAAYATSVALHKRLHVAWATKQLASERKLCRAFSQSDEMVADLVAALSSAGGGGLVAACTPAPGGSGSVSAVSEEELWAMAHLASALADMSLASAGAGHTVARGQHVVEGLVCVLQGGCLLPAPKPGGPSVLEDGTPELEQREQAVLEIRMCATRLLGALAQCMVEAIRVGKSAEQSEGEGSGENIAAVTEETSTGQQEIHDRIKSGLEAHATVLVGACVKLAGTAEDPNLQAQAIYALSCLVAASPGMADMFGSTPGSAECCLKVMLAAGKRGIAPDKVNAVAVAAAAATKTLCIASRANSCSMQEQIAGDKRLGKASAIMLEECSYVRLRQLFPGLHEAPADDGSVVEGNNSLGDHKKKGKGSLSRRGMSFSGSVMGSVRSVAMQSGGLGSSSLLDSGDFDGNEGQVAEVKDVRVVMAEIIANVAAIDGAGTKELLNPKNSILSPLRGMLKMADKHAATVASSALWALTSTDEGAKAVGADKREIIRALVKLLKNKHFPAAQANAAGCVASLARLECNLERMGAIEGCVSGLVALMKSAAQALDDIAQAPPRISGWPSSLEDSGPDPGVLEEQLVSATAAIATMSNSGPVAARIASTKGLQQGLAVALRSKAERVQLYAAGAMGNLANHTASLAAVTAAHGLVRSVVRLASQGKSTQVVETAAGAVRNLAASERGREELAKEAVVIQTLVALVSNQDVNGRETHLQAQLKAAGALGNLSADRVGLEAMAKDAAGYVSSLMKLLVSRQVDKKLARYALVALSNGASHPAITSALLESSTAVSLFVGNLLACQQREGCRGSHSLTSSLRQSNTDDSEVSFSSGPSTAQPETVAAALAGTRRAAPELAITRTAGFIAEACYLEALRQLAGASSGSEAHRGAARVAVTGGEELIRGLVEMMRKGVSALEGLADEEEVEGGSVVGVELESPLHSPHNVKELLAKVGMAGASAGLFAQLLLELRQGGGSEAEGGAPGMEGVARCLEDSCSEAVELLLELLEFELPGEMAAGSGSLGIETALVQVMFALWVICTVPRRMDQQNGNTQERFSALLAARPAALERMGSFVQRGVAQAGQVRAAQVFDPARLLAGATLGHLAAAGNVRGSLIDVVIAPDGGALGKLLMDLLYSPDICAADSRRAGGAAVGQSLRQVEATAHESVESGMAAALAASMGEVGLHGAPRALLVASAAKSLGHLSRLPHALANVDITARHARRLAALLEIAVETSPSMAAMVEGVLTAFGGLSAYSPEARTVLADLVEDDNDFAGRLSALVDPRQPWIVQAYAATTVGNLASERPSVAPLLSQQTFLSALACSLDTSVRLAFPERDDEAVPTIGADSLQSGTRDNIAFSAASVSGCLMNLSQSSVGTADSVAGCAPVLDALADVLRLAGAVALRDADDEVALSCVAYSAATVGTLLGASPETHARLFRHSGIQTGLVSAVCVPQLDTQRVTLMALCSLVPATAGRKSARLNFKSTGVGASTEESVLLRELIDANPKVRDVLGVLTDAEDPHVRQNAAWLLSL